MNLLENVLRPFLNGRNTFLLYFLWILVLIVGEVSASLQLTASKVLGTPLYPGKTVNIYSSVSHKYPALKNVTHLVLEFKIPSYFVYEHYVSNGTRSPDDVTETTDGNFRAVRFKFNELLTSEHAGVQVAVHVHEDDGFGDDSFHHSPCLVNLRYEIENPCASGFVALTEMAMTQVTFFSPACDGFGPLGQSPGGAKDSQITASSSQNGTFLPYSTKLQAGLSGWSPLRASGGELHGVHFIQFDLRAMIRTKFVFAVQGLSPKVPTEKVFLALSKDGLEWSDKTKGVDTAVDQSSNSTVMVIKILKFTHTARFVRVILPPFQKTGGGQPVYKVELYGCPGDEKMTTGNAKKVPVPVAVGMESGVIADNKITSSSQQGPEYGAQYSRLNSQSGGGAWCAGSCDSSEFLQIDLGQVYLVSELEVQSKHDESEATNSVLSFYFEYSSDGTSWEYYTANGANKLFLGSPLRNLAVRHKLFFPVYARFVRFRPQTCINMACMRVELYWYPDSDPESPVIFGRSFLLEESTNTMFFCDTEHKKSESPCKGSNDGGVTWRDLDNKVLNVLGYDPVSDVYYGISQNKKTYARSKRSPFIAWRGAGKGIWRMVKDSQSLITATEVPFIPVMPGKVDEPYDALTVPSSGVSLKRRRRSVASVNLWGSSSKGLLFKPISAADWTMAHSWINYPHGMAQWNDWEEE